MEYKNKSEGQQLSQQYHGQPPLPSQYSASAPIEFPIPPPPYSVSEPSFPQHPHPPFIQHQQSPYIIQQQPLVQHVVMQPVQVGLHPVNTTCPSCQTIIVTKVKFEANIATHIIAMILCLFCFPCAFLPYCMSSCKSSIHTCPNCSAYIGSYRPVGF